MDTANHQLSLTSRYRFSLATLLVLVTFVAALLGAWKIWSYEPPTNRIPLYEKAEGTRRSWMDVGPNRVRLAVIARNDRDGTLHVEDGQQHAVAQSQIPDSGTIAKAGPWLDVAEVRLAPGPEQIGIIDVRIFDHKTRQLISDLRPAYGWRVMDRNAVQLYGLGTALPNLVDIWFRLNSYPPNFLLAKLSKNAGATCTLGGADFKLQDIQRGNCGYSFPKGLFTLPGPDQDNGTSVLLSLHGGNFDWRYQIAAVSHTGKVVYTDVPAFLQPQKQRQLEFIRFDIDFKDLDHFEIRRYGGRHKFFFDAVELPKISTRSFAKPPTAKVLVNGHEIERNLNEFAPLEFTVATFRGTEFTGSTASEWRSILIHSTTMPNDTDKRLTVAKWTRGLSPQLWDFRYLSVKNHALMLQSRSRAFGGNAHGGAAFETFAAPLEQLGELKVMLKSPANTTPAKAATVKKTSGSPKR
ncbi:MAG TPA: hypothetical protein VFW73_02985 [Lacipirellulaceae bacterium]|nr:hypothetical protein [Lacipirellulaceae bacterium]